MRLWHRELISVLPRQQLLGQWRECCAIAKSIKEKGTPNHMLVNKVVEYPIDHFISYCNLVYTEMRNRNYNPDWYKLFNHISCEWEQVQDDWIFDGWHEERYFVQCYYNLQEKYDCGGITEEEWNKIKDKAYSCVFGWLLI